MKLISFTNNSFKNLPVLSFFFFLSVNFPLSRIQAQTSQWLVDSAINVIDGSGPLYSNLHPGDTVYLKAGFRDKLLIRNFKGSPDKPITFMNKGGIVSVQTNDYYGISILNCRYIRFSGQGNSTNFYGIQINKVLDGSGIGIGSLSSDFEIDHVLIENCNHSGIFAKTDPDCTLKVTRDSFTQFNTSIHDNYILNVGNEGMYIGSSFYSGYTINCNGKDTMVMPPVLNNVKVYNNTVQHTGWDGIQVSSAPLHCQIYNNTITDDSQAEVSNQMSGILIGGGSGCDCYNNLITNGKGDGIENHGLGSNKIYNNIIVNAGQSFLPNNPAQMKHGIFVSDASVIKDAAFYILFNTIINPKSDGIRFQSVKSKHNLIASNLIVNPGNYSWYSSANTNFTANDAYVMIPNASSDIQLKNNFFTRNISTAGISPNDYTLLPHSPLINQGSSDNLSIVTDFKNKRRPVGGLFDIGAMEYDQGNDTLLHTFNEKPVLFPNPVSSILTIRYLAVELTKTQFNVYSVKGDMVLQQNNQVVLPGVQELQIDISKLTSGLYVYAIQTEAAINYGKFIKL
jgi:hypothetical protein